MKWSFAVIGVFLLGIIGVVVIMFFMETTVTNEQDYYALKEAAEAAMIDSIDIAYYRLTGEIKISKDKFVTNFHHRFAEVATYGEGNYTIEWYDIIESPAKISIRIVDNTRKYTIFDTKVDSDDDKLQARIVNELSLIIDGEKGYC